MLYYHVHIYEYLYPNVKIETIPISSMLTKHMKTFEERLDNTITQSYVLSEQLKYFGRKGSFDIMYYVDSSCDTPSVEFIAK